MKYYFTVDFNVFHQVIFRTSLATAKVAFVCVFWSICAEQAVDARGKTTQWPPGRSAPPDLAFQKFDSFLQDIKHLYWHGESLVHHISCVGVLKTQTILPPSNPEG